MKNIALVCITETNTKDSIEKFLYAAKSALTNIKRRENQ
jgi:hypothetical protein